MQDKRVRALRIFSTEAEQRLWAALRDRPLDGFKFRRQCPIGLFIVDFMCLDCGLIIEADGGQHSENEDDARRTAWLEAQGWRVLRFWNHEILSNTEGVLETIHTALLNRRREPTLSRQAGKG